VDVEARTNIARTILLTATMRKKSKIDLATPPLALERSEGPYLKKFNLPTPPLALERSSRRTKGRRSLIVDDAISSDVEATKKTTTKTLT
jgi:hypothetical protein